VKPAVATRTRAAPDNTASIPVICSSEYAWVSWGSAPRGIDTPCIGFAPLRTPWRRAYVKTPLRNDLMCFSVVRESR